LRTTGSSLLRRANIGATRLISRIEGRNVRVPALDARVLQGLSGSSMMNWPPLLSASGPRANVRPGLATGCSRRRRSTLSAANTPTFSASRGPPRSPRRARQTGASLILNGGPTAAPTAWPGSWATSPSGSATRTKKSNAAARARAAWKARQLPMPSPESWPKRESPEDSTPPSLMSPPQGARIHTVFDRVGEALGRAIALISLFNPSAIVLIGPQALVGTSLEESYTRRRRRWLSGIS
jgi:hypothetical protein